MQDQIHEGSYELTKKSEKTILRKLHCKIVAQLVTWHKGLQGAKKIHGNGSSDGFDGVINQGVIKRIFLVERMFLRLMTHPTRFVRN